MFLQTLNIEWGQIDPKDKRRVNKVSASPLHLLKVQQNDVTLYSITKQLCFIPVTMTLLFQVLLVITFGLFSTT